MVKAVVPEPRNNLQNDNPVGNRHHQIKSKDLFGKFVLVSAEKFTKRIGVYGLLLNNDSILMQRHPELNVFGLPGGEVENIETLNQALRREFLEETGLTVSVKNLLTVTDEFFSVSDIHYHSFNIFYYVKLQGGKILTNGNGDDTAEVKFIPLKDLGPEKTQWAFHSAINLHKKLNQIA